MKSPSASKQCCSFLTLAVFLTLNGLWINNAFAENKLSDDFIPYKIEPPFAWNRTDKYEPPNFEAFFPDDAEGGKQLNLMMDGKLKITSIDQRLAIIRRGLRNTSHHRNTIMANVGNQYIWDQEKQDPRAIELLYHGSAHPHSVVAHSAFYSGPSVVSNRSLNLVRTLMEQYQSLNIHHQKRIAWGMKKYGDKEQTRKLLLELLTDYKNLNDWTIGATLDTYQNVFEIEPPDMDRFDDVGLWVIAYHRTDVSSDHPRASKILRKPLDKIFHSDKEKIVEYVTRVEDGHETAVVLLKGMRARDSLKRYLSKLSYHKIDIDEILSPKIFNNRRLHEFARHLPEGSPKQTLPTYTRPPTGVTYAYNSDEFVAPNYESYFPKDEEAGKKLDEVYANHEKMEFSDQELLDLFRRGIRSSSNSPNNMFGWISSAFGWPKDPRLTEIQYQAVDPQAPLNVREAAIYYGFGRGTTKTNNILKAKFRVYMTPPFNRSINYNMRQRILWGIGSHEDDKHYMATLFEEPLSNHAQLSDEALWATDMAYRKLTDEDPPNFSEYALRGTYLVMFLDKYSHSIKESEQLISKRFGKSKYLIATEFSEENQQVTVAILVHGMEGRKWLMDDLMKKPKMTLYLAELLSQELVGQAEILRNFKKYLPAQQPKNK